MARAILLLPLIIAVGGALWLLIAYLWKGLVVKKDEMKALEESERARYAITIAGERVTLKDVDDYILELELNGERAPLDLLRARLAVEDKQTDQGRQQAFIDLAEVLAKHKSK